MRKKVILIVTLAVLVAFGAIFAVLNIHAPGKLSTWKKMEIEYHFQKQFEREMGPWADEIESPYEAFTRYYGSENGYIILYKLENVVWGTGYLQKIANYRFVNGSGRHFRFFAYKNGKFMDLNDAYEAGLISQDMIKSIWEKYTILDRL